MKYLIALLAITSWAFAKEETTDSCCAIRNSFLRVGAAYSYVWLTPEGEDAFRGNLYGAQGIYEYAPCQSIYQALKFSWKQGKAHRHSDSRFLLDFDVHERIGYTFCPCDQAWRMTGFTGFGYRFLGHTLRQPTFENLHFDYNEFYIPLGLLASMNFDHDWDVGFNAIWMPQVFPSVNIDPLGGANWVIRRKLGNFRVELPVNYSQCREWFLELKPFFEFWQDGETTAVNEFGVHLDNPQNTYLFLGFELNVGWNF
jgi:hypothetical protein